MVESKVALKATDLVGHLDGMTAVPMAEKWGVELVARKAAWMVAKLDCMLAGLMVVLKDDSKVGQ